MKWMMIRKVSCLVLLAVAGVAVNALAAERGYTPSSRYTGEHPGVYDTGYRMGSEDARKGLSESAERHQREVDKHFHVFTEGYKAGYRNYSPPRPAGNFEAEVGQGRITITRGGERVAVCRTAMPNIEKWHFTSNQEQIVVKSRGDHGPATVQLFDTRTGTLRDKVLAYAIEYGEPAWARGMQDAVEQAPEAKPIYKPSTKYTGQNPDAYDEGYRTGRGDAMKALAFSPSRYGDDRRENYLVFTEGYTAGYRNYAPPRQATDYAAEVGQGKVTITQSGREVAVCRTAMVNVEKWHFSSDQKQLVVKSRGQHGPATVELFDTKTGTLRDKVLAHAIEYGEPAWARGMQD